MLHNKDITILSEMKNFFTSSEKVSNTIFDILKAVKLPKGSFNLPGDIRQQYSSSDIIMLMLLFPILQIKNAYNYAKSPIYYLLSCGKDVFYRLKNNSNVDWRSIVYKITMRYIKKAETKGENKNNAPKCLIIDDTDFHKTGKKIELIGRVWSHVLNQSVLGFKGLFLGYFDGKSFLGLDFSIHGEKGKNEKMPHGMTKTQLKKRYHKKRDKATAGYKRMQEYLLAKTQVMISMIKRAIKQKIQFEYILVDSWFMSESLIHFVKTRKIGYHLLSMSKMGKTRYSYKSKECTGKEIVEDLKRKKKVKKSKLLNVWYASEIVEYKNIEVKLFFCKISHRGKWNMLLTTNTAIEFEEAYKIYSSRWTIEVFFKECKQYFDLGKSQSQDFDGQIADISINILQYNTLALAKRFSDYESLGILFKDTKAEILIFTVAEQIWMYLIDILSLIAEIFEIDFDLILEKLIEENQAILKLINLKSLQNSAA